MEDFIQLNNTDIGDVFDSVFDEVIGTVSPYTSTNKYTFIRNRSSLSSQYFPGLGPKRDSLYIVIPITIVYIVILITGIIGNITTCLVIYINKSMHNATNFYLFSLAISDLLLLLTGLPQEIYYLWSRYPYIFGQVFCIGRGLAAETSANATVLTITAFTTERYIAICHPFLSYSMSKLPRAIKIIILIWVISLMAAIPLALQFGIVVAGYRGVYIKMCRLKWPFFLIGFELSTFLFFIIPMTLITVMYILIGIRLKKSSIINKSSSNSCGSAVSFAANRCNHVDGNNRHQGQSSKRVIKMLVAVVVAFFICWAPFHIQRLYSIYSSGPAAKSKTDDTGKKPELHLYEIVTYASGVLYYLSTTVNPLLYHTMSNKFRNAFKETIWCCCRISSRNQRGLQRRYSTLSRGGGANANGVIGSGTAYARVANRQHSSSGQSAGGGACAPDTSTDCSGQSGNSVCQIVHQCCGKHSTMSHHPGGCCTSITSLRQSNRSTSFSQCPRSTNATIKAGNSIRMCNARLQKAKQPRTRRLWNLFKWMSNNDNQVVHESIHFTPPLDIDFGDLENDIKQMESFLPSDQISNSSLRDPQNIAIGDELTSYMEEVHQREKSIVYSDR